MNTTPLLCALTALLCFCRQVRSEVTVVSAGSCIVDKYIGLTGSELSSDPASQSYLKATLDTGTYAKVWTSRSLKGRWNDGSYGNEIDYGLGWNGKLTKAASLDMSATYFDEPAAGSFGKGDILYLKAIGTRSFKRFSLITTWEQFVPMRKSGFRGGSLIGFGASSNKKFSNDQWNVHAWGLGVYDTGVFGNDPALLCKGSVGVDRTLSHRTTLTLIAADWWVPVSTGTHDTRRTRTMVYSGFSWNWSKQ